MSGSGKAIEVPTTPDVDIATAIPTKNYKETDSKLSKVTIITKPERLDALKAAMDEIGIMGMTVTRVMGCGVQKGQTTYYRGAKVAMDLLPKIKVEVIVSEIPVKTVVNTARKILYSGHMGDGKIFVYDVENVVRISSGAQGVEALQYED